MAKDSAHMTKPSGVSIDNMDLLRVIVRGLKYLIVLLEKLERGEKV